MTPHPCEDCGAPATSHRQIGGIRAWRCAACCARAERDDGRQPAPLPPRPARQATPAQLEMELV